MLFSTLRRLFAMNQSFLILAFFLDTVISLRNNYGQKVVRFLLKLYINTSFEQRLKNQ